jgi:serine O-acetyltransferase
MEIGRLVTSEEDLGDGRPRGPEVAKAQGPKGSGAQESYGSGSYASGSYAAGSYASGSYAQASYGQGEGSGRSRRSFAEEGRFAHVVDALVGVSEAQARQRQPSGGWSLLPSREAIAGGIENLCAALFPRHFGSSEHAAASLRYYVGARLDEAALTFEEQVRRGLAVSCEHGVASGVGCVVCSRRAGEVVEGLFSSLARIRELLESDIVAAYDGDPAATYLDETLYCYPGVMAITRHRIAHELFRAEVPLIPRIIAQQSHAATGIDIHPGAQIGRSFFIDHGTGVVIGETCEIGDQVRIYQGVTLGAREFPSQDGTLLRGLLRHPIVGDNVVIYAGATILGRVTIGAGSIIGGNVWLTHSVPSESRVSQAQVRHRVHGNGSGI